MRKLLSQALDFSSTAVCNGYEVEEVGQVDGVIRLSLADDTDLSFKDQEIEINFSGDADAVDVEGIEASLHFRVSIPIREVDFPK